MADTLTPVPSTQDERDTHHLASLGYRQELQRTLGLFSNFAVAFSYISVSTGTFALFALGIATGGPAFFWSWPIVAAGQFLVALNFAELSSHYPVAGSIYPDQLTKAQEAQSAIGQYDVRVTPLQMAMVAAGVANNGVVMRPYLVKEVQAPDLSQLDDFDRKGQIGSDFPETAHDAPGFRRAVDP